MNYLRFFLRDFIELKIFLKKIEKVYIAGGSSNLKSLLISAFLKKKIYLHIHDVKSNFLIRFLLFIFSKYIKKIFFASKCSKDYYSFLSNKPKKIILRSSVNTNDFKPNKKRSKQFNVGIIANINEKI